MNFLKNFTPMHLNATSEDFKCNQAYGPYVLLPGSDGRARQIADQFENMRVIESQRAHNVYFGTLKDGDRSIDVATVSTGMGCPSIDIILNELFYLGARRFLRVGTSGSVQPQRIPVGHMVVATSAVRDEATSRNYLPVEIPAVASFPVLIAAHEVAKRPEYTDLIHFGTAHTKDSLFAREFKVGPESNDHESYMQTLHQAGVLASEMETAQLFILTALFNQWVQEKDPKAKVLGGSLLAIVGDDQPFASKEKQAKAVEQTITFAFDVVKELAKLES